MAQIRVQHLSFTYETGAEPVFSDVSFSIDTAWKLGLVGRNGRGKTTFLKLLAGMYPFEGTIAGAGDVTLFPPEIPAGAERMRAGEVMELLRPEAQAWEVRARMGALGLEEEIGERIFSQLSGGERTKLLLALFFSGEHGFLLIDEPTNHLDAGTRGQILDFLRRQKSFLVVSHDRDLLDACVDHLLVLGKSEIEVQAGNYSSWRLNRERMDRFREAENEKHLGEIRKLEKALDRTKRWADKSEASKIGFDPVAEHDRSIATRSYIGARTKKLQSRASNTRRRLEREVEEKRGLLENIEHPDALKLCPLSYRREVLVRAKDLGLSFAGPGEKTLFSGLSFTVERGERVRVTGGNGAGKTSLLRAVLARAGAFPLPEGMVLSGELEAGSGLVISHVGQDLPAFAGDLAGYASSEGIDRTLLFSLLAQLGFPPGLYGRPLAEYSDGQRKKAMIAASLAKSAHLYVWDEPLGYIDVFSREQVEDLILRCAPTLLFVEHDVRFSEKIATKEISWEAEEGRKR